MNSGTGLLGIHLEKTGMYTCSETSSKLFISCRSQNSRDTGEWEVGDINVSGQQEARTSLLAAK